MHGVGQAEAGMHGCVVAWSGIITFSNVKFLPKSSFETASRCMPGFDFIRNEWMGAISGAAQ